VTFSGSPQGVTRGAEILTELITIVRMGQGLTADAVERVVAMTGGEGDLQPSAVLTQDILSNRGKTIRPKTLNQKRYVDAIDAHTIVFGIGPAGTGKTYLAMAKAVQALQAKVVNRIILTRPAIEAGEPSTPTTTWSVHSICDASLRTGSGTGPAGCGRSGTPPASPGLARKATVHGPDGRRPPHR
jgi:phosphate starvation-inducible protein PhoH